MPHVFKPGDMALVKRDVHPSCIEGLFCIIESHPYVHTVFRFDGSPYEISCVDITVVHPIICKANVECLEYIPPEEWPEPVFKERRLVRVEGAPHVSDTKQREPATTE